MYRSSGLRHIISFAMVLLVPLILLGCGADAYPSPNNIDRIEDIITVYYSDDELSDLLNGYYNGIYNYLHDLDGVYQIECIRDPRQYDESYLPYVVIMSESGKKAFLFFLPLEEPQKIGDPGEILGCILVDSFLSKDELEQTLYELPKSHATWADWVVILKKYETSILSGTWHRSFMLAAKEGVYGLVITHAESEYEQIVQMAYFSDTSLMQDPGAARSEGWDPWLILPIDKA